MIAGKKITEPPVITTVTPPTPAPGNLMACGGVKLFQFNIQMQDYFYYIINYTYCHFYQ